MRRSFRRGFSWLAFGTFLAVVHGAEPVSKPAGATLPAIEIDPQSRTSFRERGTHRPFVAIGVNYFDPETGWAPKLWGQFDPVRIQRQLDLLASARFNTIRIFLASTAFHTEPGQLNDAGMKKFRQLLEWCRERGIYVIPTGPDSWEGSPPWRDGDQFANEKMLEADDAWWRAFTAAMRGESTILAFDLLNEPSVPWDTPAIKKRWAEQGGGDIPAAKAAPGDEKLVKYQRFRESLAHTWTKRKVNAIHGADAHRLVTVGHIQWASPILLPSVQHYAAFDLADNAKLVDFVTIHFYPLDWPKPCDKPEGMWCNSIYLQRLIHEASQSGKPVMLGEFGWYGGGAIPPSQLPDKPVEHQLEWGKELLGATRGRLCGWLNWAMADTPTSTDLTRWSGIWTTDFRVKPWGAAYIAFAKEPHGAEPFRAFPPCIATPNAPREELITSPDAGNTLRQQIRAACAQQ